jgi:hypothetical protein
MVVANSRRLDEKSAATIFSTPRLPSAAMIAIPIGVAHEYVAAEVDVDVSRRTMIKLPGERQHFFAVLGKVQVGAADATRTDADQDLSRPGDRFIDVVAGNHSPAAQH